MTAIDVMMWLTFAMIVAMVVAFAMERWSIELVSIASLVAWLVLFWLAPMMLDIDSPLRPDALLAGFSNQALITVLAMLVIGQGLFQTDALERPTAILARYGSKTGMGAVILILFVVMVTSAVVNDTPVVVMFLPIISAIAAARGIATSKVLMPLSFAALLGGKTTLIGTSTNLLAAGVAEQAGGLMVSFFEFTIPAAIMAVFGFAYVALVLPRILPARAGMADQMTGGSGKQFIAQIDVTYGHPLAGMESVSGMFPALKDMTVRLVQRGEHPFLPPFENLMLRPGDTVIVAATRHALTRAISEAAATPASRESGDFEGETPPVMPTKDVTLAEAVVAPGSRLIGRTIEQAAIHLETGTVVLGVERRSRMPRMPLSDIRLEAGDVLLVGGTREAIEGLRLNRDLLLLEWSAADLPTRRYARRALIIFAAMVVYAASGIGPIVIGALAGAFAMIAFGCLNIRQAMRAFDHRIFLMVGASLAAAAALEATGGAIFIANAALDAVLDYPVSVTLSVLFLVVAVLTNVLSNNATAVLFTPIALQLALRTGNDPMPFVVAVILAASCAFASPIGYQTNLLVMGPGHYRFRDYVIGGSPLVLLMWVVYTFVGPWYYGLW
ncbi:SLC13 family permease [Bauldia sp.]|uniref:SLC13 family permease n=1 Tax=Bauldia sp. TaxID=2575872 RepID=UPI003BAAAA28